MRHAYLYIDAYMCMRALSLVECTTDLLSQQNKLHQGDYKRGGKAGDGVCVWDVVTVVGRGEEGLLAPSYWQWSVIDMHLERGY